jgi:hypothetical protein
LLRPHSPHRQARRHQPRTDERLGSYAAIWSQVGTGDHQVGRDYVDELLDGKKKEPKSPRFAEAMESMAADYEHRIWELQEEIDVLREAAASSKRQRKDVLLGMFFLDGQPSQAEVKKEARKQYKRWHPDQGVISEVFKRLKAAEEELLKLC